jgi:FkbM family methyltransferase
MPRFMETNPLFYLRNWLQYSAEFGIPEAIKLIRQRRSRRATWTIHPRGFRHPVVCRNETSDFIVLRQIVGRQEVAFSLHPRPDTIIDAGANIGLASVLFANRWPEARILAVEPEARNFALLQQNTSPYPQIQCLRAALWNARLPLTITNPEAEAFAFQVAPNEGFESSDVIPGVTVFDLMDRLNTKRLGLLKIDIEGAEKHVLSRNCCAWLSRVNAVAVEPHERYSPGILKQLDEVFTGWIRHQQGEYRVYGNPEAT